MSLVSVSDGYTSKVINTDDIVTIVNEYNTFSKDKALMKLKSGGVFKAIGKKEDYINDDFLIIKTSSDSVAINKKNIVSMETNYSTFSRTKTIIKLSDGQIIEALGPKEDFL